MAAKILSAGDSPTILVGLFILEAGGVICLDGAPPEEETEISKKGQGVYLDADAQEHG